MAETEVRIIRADSFPCEGVTNGGWNRLDGRPVYPTVTIYDPPAQSVACTALGDKGLCQAGASEDYQRECPYLRPEIISSLNPMPISPEQADKPLIITPETTAAAIRELGWQGEGVSFPVKMRDLRTSMGLDRHEFAERLHVHPQSITYWEHEGPAHRIPTIHVLVSLRPLCGVPNPVILGLIGLSGVLESKKEE